MANNTGAWWCCGWHPGSDRGVISQRLQRTRTRTRTGLSSMGNDILCSFSEVLRRFGLLQRNAGVTTGSDRVGVRRQIHGRPPEVSFLSLFLEKNWSPPGRDWVMTVNVWEQRAGNGRLFAWRTKGRCPAPAHPHPPGSPSALWVSVSFPRCLDGAVSSPPLWLGSGSGC